MISRCRIFSLSLVYVAPLVLAAPSAAQVFPYDSPDIAIFESTEVAQAENSVFIDPLDSDRVLTAHNTTPGTGFFVSIDGGKTWTGNPQVSPMAFSCCDPTTTISRSGRFNVGYQFQGDVTQKVGFLDANGIEDFAGEAFTEVIVAGKPAVIPPAILTFLDKPHLWIDNSPTSAFEGTLYNAWSDIYFLPPPVPLDRARSLSDTPRTAA